MSSADMETMIRSAYARGWTEGENAGAEGIESLAAEIARLQDLVAKFQRGEPSDKFEKHGA